MGAEGALQNVNPSALTPTYPAGAAATVTVGWIESITKQTTRRSYRTALTQFLKWLGERVIKEPWTPETVSVNVAAGDAGQSFSAETVKKYLAHLEAEGLKVGSVNQRLSVLRRWARALGDAGLIHPVRLASILNIEGVKGSDDSMRSSLTDVEVQVVLDSIDTSTLIGKRDKALLALLSWDGLRRAELCSLKLGQLKTQGGHHLIDDLERKGRNRVGWVKVTAPLVRALQAWWEAAGLTESAHPMFCSIDQHGIPSRQPLSAHAVYLVVKRRAKAAGLEGNITPHSMRRSMATNMAENGAPVTAIQSAGGWRSRSMVDHYCQVRASLDKNGVDYLHYVL